MSRYKLDVTEEQEKREKKKIITVIAFVTSGKPKNQNTNKVNVGRNRKIMAWWLRSPDSYFECPGSNIGHGIFPVGCFHCVISFSEGGFCGLVLSSCAVTG